MIKPGDLNSSRIFLISAGLLLVLLGLRIFSPFLGTLLAAASVSLLLAPIYRSLSTRAPKHPIVAGLPVKWLHAKDELYDRLRGPAENLTVLATAFSDSQKSGTGRHEPMLMITTFGQGRVFHTALGHAGRNVKPEAMLCVGFIATFQRGAEWTVTGQVTQKVPADFPTADRVSLRE